MNPTMRAVLGDQLGPPENYRLVELPMPQPGRGQIRLRVHACALGYADGLIAQGRYQVRPPLPYVPGCEFSGVVDAIGPEVAPGLLGQRVAAQNFGGGLADYALAPAASAQATPDALDDAEAAAFWADYATALHALRDRARLVPGETVLVLGAAGGVGLAAIQVAVALGGEVIAAASRADKRAAAQRAGATRTIDYTAADWTEQLKAMTSQRGVDVIFDPVGGSTFEPAFRRLAWGGRHLVIGFTGGSIPALPANLALLKGASLVGVDVRQFATMHEPELARRERGELAEMVRTGHLRPVIGARFALVDFRAALAACQQRDRIGKTVVEVAP
jgi:NADPH2:quinone reductase